LIVGIIIVISGIFMYLNVNVSTVLERFIAINLYIPVGSSIVIITVIIVILDYLVISRKGITISSKIKAIFLTALLVGILFLSGGFISHLSEAYNRLTGVYL
jgi:hypothetical protein